jgi:hypothetical protein
MKIDDEFQLISLQREIDDFCKFAEDWQVNILQLAVMQVITQLSLLKTVDAVNKLTESVNGLIVQAELQSVPLEEKEIH